jgi:hypothetical protein
MVDRLLDLSSFSKGVMNLADPSVTILAASFRLKDTVERTFVITGRTDPKTSFLSSDTLNVTEFSYTRTVWVPSVLDTLPEFTPGVVVDSASKITDLFALIANRFNPFYRPGIIL